MSISIPDCRNVHDESTLDKFELIASPQDWFQFRNNGEYCKDASSVQFLHLPESKEVSINLHRKHPEDDFDAFAKGDCPYHSYFPSQSRSFEEAEFVFESDWALADLLKLPFKFDSSREWIKKVIFLILKSHGKYFIVQKTEDEPVFPNPPEGKVEKHVFVRSFLSPSREIRPDSGSPIKNEDAQTLVMYHGTLGEHKLLYPAIVDGFDKDVDLANIACERIAHLKYFRRASKNFVSWNVWSNYWAKIVVAKGKLLTGYYDYRLKDGIMKNWDLLDEEQIYINLENSWRSYQKSTPPSKYLCMNFLNDFLCFIKTELQDANEDEVYEFSFDVADPSREGKLRPSEIFSPAEIYQRIGKI